MGVSEYLRGGRKGEEALGGWGGDGEEGSEGSIHARVHTWDTPGTHLPITHAGLLTQ